LSLAVAKEAKKVRYWDVPMEKSMVATKDEKSDARKALY